MFDYKDFYTDRDFNSRREMQSNFLNSGPGWMNLFWFYWFISRG